MRFIAFLRRDPVKRDPVRKEPVMGTLTEEIFSYKLGRPVQEGETVVVDVDHVMSHDTSTPLAIKAFRELTRHTNGRVFNADRSHIVFDHIIPAATIAAATLHRDIRGFANEQGIAVLQEGICHQVMPERGFVTPGSIIVGGDSHTCTYGALELSPPAWARPISLWLMPPDAPGSASPPRSMCVSPARCPLASMPKI